MAEAAVFQSANSLRHLFCTILAFCFPANPFELFTKFKDDLSDDYLHKLQNDDSVDPAMIDIEKRAHDHCLLELDEIL